MKKPLKKDFGWENWCGWASGNLNEYLKELKRWENRPRQATAGRERKTKIHESWMPYIIHFDPSNPQRSQGAFARWLGVNSATVSAAKRKPITDKMRQWISEWVYIGDGEGLEGSMNTNKDRVHGK